MDLFRNRLGKGILLRRMCSDAGAAGCILLSLLLLLLSQLLFMAVAML